MFTCLLRPARSIQIALIFSPLLASGFEVSAQDERRPESKSRPNPTATKRAGKPTNPPILPPVRMPERNTFWDEQETESEENKELAVGLMMIPFEILFSDAAQSIFSAGSQSVHAGYDAWKGYRDPGRNVDDRYTQAAIRLRDAKNPHLRRKAIVVLTSIPDPSAAKNDLKKALRYDPSAEVRKSAAVALGKIGELDCLDYLNKAMRYDSSADVRRTCSLIVARSNSKFGEGAAKTAAPLIEKAETTVPMPKGPRR